MYIHTYTSLSVSLCSDSDITRTSWAATGWTTGPRTSLSSTSCVTPGTWSAWRSVRFRSATWTSSSECNGSNLALFPSPRRRIASWLKCWAFSVFPARYRVQEKNIIGLIGRFYRALKWHNWTIGLISMEWSAWPPARLATSLAPHPFPRGLGGEAGFHVTSWLRRSLNSVSGEKEQLFCRSWGFVEAY